jgi:hypothetical protein
MQTLQGKGETGKQFRGEKIQASDAERRDRQVMGRGETGV